MTFDLPTVITIVVAVGTALGTVVWWVIRENARLAASAAERIDDERGERIRSMEMDRKLFLDASQGDRKLFLEMFERQAATWMTTLEREREVAKSDRHELRDVLSILSNQLNAFKLEAAEKFVSYPALEKALQPLERDTAEIKGTLADIYRELRGKADRPNKGG